MSVTTLRRCLATMLASALLSAASSGPLLATSQPTLTGRVLADNGADSRAGVVVTLVDPSTEKMFRSEPTDARGSFRVEAPAPGSYAVVVEAPEGAFLASNDIALAPGLNRPVSLTLKSGRAGTAPAGSKPEEPSKKKSGVPTWAKWVIAGGIVVGGVIIIDAVTKNDTEASKSN